MNKQAVIEEISILVADAISRLREAKRLAEENTVPFNFQIATLAGKQFGRDSRYDGSDDYIGYPDIVSTGDFEYEGWQNSSIGC